MKIPAALLGLTVLGVGLAFAMKGGGSGNGNGSGCFDHLYQADGSIGFDLDGRGISVQTNMNAENSQKAVDLGINALAARQAGSPLSDFQIATLLSEDFPGCDWLKLMLPNQDMSVYTPKTRAVAEGIMAVLNTILA